MKKKFHNNVSVVNSASERGSFLTEFTLVIPILLFLLVGSIDLSVGMLNHLRVSRVAYEAARYGASLPNMSGKFDVTRSICEQDPFSVDPSRKQLGMVITRAQKIIGESYLYFTDKSLVDYRVSYEASNRKVHICIIVPWNSVMPGFLEKLGIGVNSLGGNIKSSVSAPYLFSS